MFKDSDLLILNACIFFSYVLFHIHWRSNASSALGIAGMSDWMAFATEHPTCDTANAILEYDVDLFEL
jgi:hypothetical protein